MNDAKYIGLDVHQATISVAVRDSAGKLVSDGRNLACQGKTRQMINPAKDGSRQTRLLFQMFCVET